MGSLLGDHTRSHNPTFTFGNSSCRRPGGSHGVCVRYVLYSSMYISSIDLCAMILQVGAFCHGTTKKRKQEEAGEWLECWTPKHHTTNYCTFLILLYSIVYLLYYSVLVQSTLLYSTPLYSTLLYSTLLYSTLLYSTLLYSTLLYSTLLYSTLLYSTLLYSTLLYRLQICQLFLISMRELFSGSHDRLKEAWDRVQINWGEYKCDWFSPVAWLLCSGGVSR